VIHVGDHERESQLPRDFVEHIEQRHGIAPPDTATSASPAYEEPILVNVCQHARRQRASSGHVS